MRKLLFPILYGQNLSVISFKFDETDQTANTAGTTVLEACLMYIRGDALTNKSLRDRFNLKETSAGSISRLIKESIAEGKIKPLGMKYIPGWA